MAARHLSKEFAEEQEPTDGQEDDYVSPYATAKAGRHLKKPVVQYVPTISVDSFAIPQVEDAQADERAREHVESIFRELAVDATPTEAQDAPEHQQTPGAMMLHPSTSLESLPGFGPSQADLASFIPSVEAVPHNWGKAASEGVFARHEQRSQDPQDPSATIVLSQQELHGVRRRRDYMAHRQIDLSSSSRRKGNAFGYFKPVETTSSEVGTSLTLANPRKSIITLIAEFIARLFGKGDQ